MDLRVSVPSSPLAWPTTAMAPGPLTVTGSPPGPAPLHVMRRPVSGTATGSPGREPPGEPDTAHRRGHQIRLDTDGRTYYRCKRSEGKKPMEAVRCLERRIFDAAHRQLFADAQAASDSRAGAGPGKALCGASQESSAAGLPPHIDTSEQPLPGPANPTLARHRSPGRPAAK